MNILVPYSWIKEFADIKASPEEVAERLSLHSFSVENIEKTPDGDAVFEIEITPNRPDAMSVFGIAREVRAVFSYLGEDVDFTDEIPDIKLKTNKSKPLELDVEIKDESLCPRFAAIVLENVEVKPSPALVQDRLQAVGLRPLNNAIDITNYVMIERGQPMHVFDYDKIAAVRDPKSASGMIEKSESGVRNAVSGERNSESRKMILRASKKGEKIVTLDGEQRELPEGTIVIEDGEKIIDLCGIMGGANSCVDENTERVVIFVQIYDPLRIRETVQKMAFRTDAATRFEKGMDPRAVLPAMKTAVDFLVEHAGARVAGDLIDIENKEYEKQEIDLPISMVEDVLGVKMDSGEAASILKSLGFDVKWETAPQEMHVAPELRVTVPSWRRNDIFEAVDLVEEVARVYGYHNLPQNLPPLPYELHSADSIFEWERKVRNLFRGWGFLETTTYSFTNEDVLSKAGFAPENTVEIENPLNDRLTHLRPSLLPHLLEILADNQKEKEQLKFFQLSRVFLPLADENELPLEVQRLTALESFAGDSEKAFLRVKGYVETLLEKMGVIGTEFARAENAENYWRKNAVAEVRLGEEVLGRCGLVRREVLDSFGVEGNAGLLDFDFNAFTGTAEKVRVYEPLPTAPPVVEDLTFVMDEKAPVGEVLTALEDLSSEDYLIEANLKDVYRDDTLEEEGKKAVTVTLKYQPYEGSLSDEEVAPIRKSAVETVTSVFPASLRGEL